MTWFEAKKKILKKLSLALKKQTNFRDWNTYIDNQMPGAGLTESFKEDCWVVKVGDQSRDILKNAIHKEMPSRVAGLY